MSKTTDDIDVLIEAGDSFFKASNYDKAIKAYTEAIGKSANTNSRAYSNRSAVSLYSKQAFARLRRRSQSHRPWRPFEWEDTVSRW